MAGVASASITRPTPKYPQSTGLVCRQWGTAPRGEIGAEYAGVDETARGIAGAVYSPRRWSISRSNRGISGTVTGNACFFGKVRRRFAVSSLRCPILSELTEEVGQLKADKRWRDNLQRFQESQDFTPEVPSTLQAELRDYQLEGFRWLARLAQWGPGLFGR